MITEEYSGRELWSSKFFRITNSAVSSFLALLLAILVCGVAKAFFMKTFGIKSHLTFYDAFPVTSDPNVWYLKNVLIIYSSGIIATLLLGLAGLYLFHNLKRYDLSFSVFFIWLYVWALNIFCSQALLALLGLEEYYSPYFNNLVVVLAWLRFPKILAYLLVPISIGVLTFLSIYFIRPFISMAYSYGKVNKLNRRRKYFFETAMVPLFISSLFVVAILVPEPFTYTGLIYIGYGLLSMIIGWYMLFYVDIDRENMFRQKALQKFSFTLFGMLVIFLVLIHWKLQYGIKIS
ncbi:MAG: hypothetical protein NZ522_06165 [Chitinophagales bacterium]|nr:hypothetical protein [Chitinophagales bacterium]